MSRSKSEPRRHSSYRLEVCVESIGDVITAQSGGADRVELCGSLLEGGITPSHGFIAAALERASVPVSVMIRPRGGDFVYDAPELEVMRRDIELVRELGGSGVVLGVLREDGTIDAPRTRELVEHARPLEVTFHRAFDMTRDLREALDVLLDVGVRRVLTSGGARSVPEELDAIAEFVKRAGDRMSVMPGGGITEENLREVIARSRASEYHVSARGTCASPMRHRNERCALGPAGDEYVRRGTDEERVRAFVEILRKEGS